MQEQDIKVSIKEKMILPCLRGVIGNWVYYSTLMNAKQISSWVQPVKDIREAKTLDDLLQRDLNERKKRIAAYLQKDETRFFNSIIVGVFDGIPDWLEFDLSKASSYFSSNLELKAIKESVGMLIFNGDEKMFAIDGQHRVAGIDIASKEDLQNPNDKQILKDDQFSVILVAHIDDKLGKKRTRKLFSDINKNAKPVAGGDRIKIDEQDLYAIVARRIYAEYSHFKGGKLIDLTEQANLSRGDVSHFTNLLGLYTVNKIIGRALFKKQKGSQDWDEENVIKLKNLVTGFYNFVIKHTPSYNNYFIENNISLEEERKNNKNILFRPIGLFLLARLYSYYYDQRLPILAEALPLISFDMPNSPFNGVLWSNGRLEAKSKNQILAYDLALYVLNEKGLTEELGTRYKDILKNSSAELPNQIL